MFSTSQTWRNIPESGVEKIINETFTKDLHFIIPSIHQSYFMHFYNWNNSSKTSS